MVLGYIGNFCRLQRRTSWIHRHIYLVQVILHFLVHSQHIFSLKRYILLCQICARLNLQIGKAPSCFHFSLLKAIFERSPDEPIHLNYSFLIQLEWGDNTSLIDANVVPSNDATRNIEQFVNAFCIILKYAAIKQIRKGIFFYLSKVIRISMLFFVKYFTDEKSNVEKGEKRSSL